MILFARLLRETGIRITSRQLADVVNGLRLAGDFDRDAMRITMRCVLVHRREDLALFDRAFDAFWIERATGQLLPGIPGPSLPAPQPRRNQERDESMSEGSTTSHESGSIFAVDDGEGAPNEDEGEATLTVYSAREQLRAKDFALLTVEELEDAKRFLAEMRWTMARRRSRRTGPSRSGRRLDVRRSLRRSLRHGGEMVELARRSPKVKSRPLVLLCDVSGSMERYTRLMLHFLHSIEASAPRSEVFLFGTRLTRITAELRRRDPDAALRGVAQQVHDWSGGTRIGDALREFNRRWARRVLGHGAIVMVISDGWDRGEPEVLAAEMRRLQRASHRLIWLNPLLGSPDYRPLTQGIMAALPYVDTFLPVHNLQSLEELAALLSAIQDVRPSRAQSRDPERVSDSTET